MDPLTAFGLACNVIQVLSFGHEVLSMCRRVCCDGSLEPDLAYNSERLQSLSKKLLVSLNAVQPTDGLSAEQNDLRQIASKLMQVTAQLNKLIEVVTVEKPSRRAIFMNTMKYLLKYKGKVQSLEKTMASLQNTMNSGILTHLCSISEANALKSQLNLSKLDESLQQFINQCSSGNQTVTALISKEAVSIREYVSVESAKTRRQAVTSIQELQHTASTADRYKCFLNSLKFDEMNGRRSAIGRSHQETCQWILDDSVDGPWDSFVRWLKSDHMDFYWISGKAGSGKSTLMKFIIGNDEVKKILSERNPSTIFVSFFYWNSGTRLQRSITGMLCSLLHQILSENTTILANILEGPAFSSKETIFDWSTEELELAILEVFSNRTYLFCLFLDGLDEIDHADGQVELIRMLDKFRCQPNIKVCVASRPEPTLQNTLKAYPKLRLQDLTRKDIDNYVNGALGNFQSVINSENDESKNLLTYMISSRADGVFLWVKLVVKSLQAGVTNADNWDTLMKRVSRLPRDIDRLYNHMWSRLNEDQELYRSDAAFYFKLILNALKFRNKGVSLFELMVASEKSLDDQNFEDSGELIQLCKTFENRVAVRCAGLLEVVWSPKIQGIPNTKMANIALSQLKTISMETTVTFIHRSAQDFLLETYAGKQILSYCLKSDEECCSDLIRAIIAQATILRDPEDLEWDYNQHSLGPSEFIMPCFLAASEFLSEQTIFRLLDLYKKTVQQEFKDIEASIPFLCLAAKYGYFTYVYYHVNQLETKFGRFPTKSKSRLLYAACKSLTFSMFPHIRVVDDLKKANPGKSELISWLLEVGADPNLPIVRRRIDHESSFAVFLKSRFYWEPSSRHHSIVTLQTLIDFAGDLSTKTLLYCYKSFSMSWYLDIHCPAFEPSPRNYPPSYIKHVDSMIIIELNCSWLARALKSLHEEQEPSDCNTKEQPLALMPNVEPQFRVLQVFLWDSYLVEDELDTSFEDNLKPLASLLQDYLSSGRTLYSPGDRIEDAVYEVYKRSPCKKEESIQNWLVRKGYMAKLD